MTAGCRERPGRGESSRRGFPRAALLPARGSTAPSAETGEGRIPGDNTTHQARRAFLAPLLIALSLLLPRATVAEPAGDTEIVKGEPEARLVVDEAVSPAPHDPRLDLAFRADCAVEIAENGIYVRRFDVHVPDADALPYARRAGRLLALLWGAADRRLGTLAVGLRREPVDVWLTRGGPDQAAGGEQFRTNIYVYNVASERAPIEWAREVAHEYGHYLLPGASGYTDPENWANGVLGQRLFLRWLRDDLARSVIPPEEMPYVTRADLDDYCAKQVTPLIDRVRTAGPDAALLAGTDRRAMDAFTGLLLYADETYGSRSLMGILDFLPPNASAGVRGTDFLAALEASLAARDRFTTRIPGVGRVFAPAGRYVVRVEPASVPVTALHVEGAQVTPRGSGYWSVRVARPGWLAMRAGPQRSDGDHVAALEWRRVGG